MSGCYLRDDPPTVDVLDGDIWDRPADLHRYIRSAGTWVDTGVSPLWTQAGARNGQQPAGDTGRHVEPEKKSLSVTITDAMRSGVARALASIEAEQRQAKGLKHYFGHDNLCVDCGANYMEVETPWGCPGKSPAPIEFDTASAETATFTISAPIAWNADTFSPHVFVGGKCHYCNAPKGMPPNCPGMPNYDAILLAARKRREAENNYLEGPSAKDLHEPMDGAALFRALSIPDPHAQSVHERLMPWRGRE